MSAVAPLLPLERGFLYAIGVLKFNPPPPKKKRHYGGRKPGYLVVARPGSNYGKVKTAAAAFIDAGYTSASLHEQAKKHGFTYDSFKGAVWKMRKEREKTHNRIGRRQREVAA